MNIQDYQNVTITKSLSYIPAMVQRWQNGRLELALNWRELADEAMHAIEPELRSRWRGYWDSVTARAAIVRDAADVNFMMELIQRPLGHYTCPPEIAARAIWPTMRADTLRLVEADNFR